MSERWSKARTLSEKQSAADGGGVDSGTLQSACKWCCNPRRSLGTGQGGNLCGPQMLVWLSFVAPDHGLCRNWQVSWSIDRFLSSRRSECAQRSVQVEMFTCGLHKTLSGCNPSLIFSEQAGSERPIFRRVCDKLLFHVFLWSAHHGVCC